MKLFNALLSCTVLGLFATGVRADDAKRPLDQDFLVKASTCSNACVEVSSLAEKRAESPKVKEFAAVMVTEHKKCQDRLAEQTKNRKIAVVSGLEQETKTDIDNLSKLKGAEFDRAYLSWIIKGHREGIAMLQNQADNGKDNDLRTFAKEQIPGMKEHLARAEELSKSAN